MFEQDIAPVLGSLALSAIAAALPLVLLFVLLGVFKVRAPFAAIAALALSIVLAIVGWSMPPVQALSAAAAGVFYGLFPILWILVNALWVYRLTTVTPWFEVFGRTIRSVSDDLRILSILIAFCFGALLESLAGFGAPVAISAAMLLAAGMAPLKAALVSLLANTAPVAFGALAAPVIALSGVTGLPLHDLASMAGRQTPFMALLVPLILVFLVDGRRGLTQTWPVALVAGAVFGLAQFITSNYFAVELTDVVAAVATIAAVLLMLRVWQPAELVGISGAVSTDAVAVPRPPAREVLMSVAPYGIIMAVFSIAQIPALKQWLASLSLTFAWPGLDVVTAEGVAAGAQQFHLDTLGATGTLLLISGLITAALYRIAPRTGGRRLPCDPAPVALDDRDRHSRTGALVRHEPLGPGDLARGRPRLGGRLLRRALADHRLDRGRADGIGHLVERAVRPRAGGRGGAGGPAAGAHGRGELVGGGARQDAVGAEPRGGRGRGRNGRLGRHAAAPPAALEHRAARAHHRAHRAAVDPRRARLDGALTARRHGRMVP